MILSIIGCFVLFAIASFFAYGATIAFWTMYVLNDHKEMYIPAILFIISIILYCSSFAVSPISISIEYGGEQ